MVLLRVTSEKVLGIQRALLWVGYRSHGPSRRLHRDAENLKASPRRNNEFCNFQVDSSPLHVMFQIHEDTRRFGR